MKTVLWTSPGCPRCKGVAQQMTAKGIEFEKHEVETDEDTNFLLEKGFSSAPVLQVEDQYMAGKDIFTWIKEH